MRIGELSQRSGVPLPTIKFYLREGLLPPGERTGPNQADYTEAHLHRIALLRALIEVGGVSVADSRRAMSLVDEQNGDPLGTLGKVHYALSRSPAPGTDAVFTAAQRRAEELIEASGWTVGPHTPARAMLIEALAAITRSGREPSAQLLAGYARAATEIAACDLEEVRTQAPNLIEMAEEVVIWTVLGDRLSAALRRLAQESEARRIFAAPPPDGDTAQSQP